MRTIRDLSLAKRTGGQAGMVMVAFALVTRGSFAGQEHAAVPSAANLIARGLGVAAANVRPSPIAGVFLVQHGHEFGYVSADGKYLLRGDLVDLSTGRDLTEDARRADRLSAIDAIGVANAIEFAAPASAPKKGIVTVFTDVDCGYCRRFHSQIHDYNARGITVRYLAWPRSGPNTVSWRRAEGVWCSKDRAEALTAAKRGDFVPPSTCKNPVAREYQLGVELGVHGTPTMILPDGELLAGYLSPDDLAAKLDAATRSDASQRSP